MTDQPVEQRHQISVDGPLSFYDHHRQSYGHLPIHGNAEAEFMVGDYGADDDNGVGTGGEFKITLKRLQSGSLDGTRLHPHLEVFGDAVGSLRAAIDAGLLTALIETVGDRDEFAQRLLDLGLGDRSARPIGSAPPECPCCGRPKP